jgi:hypothetical protein
VSERERANRASRLRRKTATAGQCGAGRERSGASCVERAERSEVDGVQGYPQPKRSAPASERARESGRLRAVGASASLAEALAEAGGAKPPGTH